MKIHHFFLFNLTLILLSNPVLAGTTTLKTYYPAPVAAYQQVKISTSTANTINNTCNSQNVGALYWDSGSNTMKSCTCQANGSNCTPTAVVYPPACYNIFCSYTAPFPGCAAVPSCQNGFGYLQKNGIITATINANVVPDQFQVASSPNTFVVSYICCSM